MWEQGETVGPQGGERRAGERGRPWRSTSGGRAGSAAGGGARRGRMADGRKTTGTSETTKEQKDRVLPATKTHDEMGGGELSALALLRAVPKMQSKLREFVASCSCPLEVQSQFHDEK